MKLFRHTFLFLMILVSGITVLYATNITVTPPSDLLPRINQEDSGDVIGTIIAWFIELTAVLAILAITWSGIQMVLATGEEEKFKKARYTMIYAFVGLIITGLAYGIVTFITNLNLNNFIG